MRRLAILILVAAAAVVASWWWWTQPPAAPTEELAALLHEVPADADGAVAIAQPGRAARWLMRRSQALALLLASAGRSGPALRRLEPGARALAASADSGLLVWWRGDEAAVAAPLPERMLRPLALVAGRSQLVLSRRTRKGGGPLMVFATSSAILAAPGNRLRAPERGKATALALVSGRVWLVTATRSRIAATTGAPPALPELGSLSRAEFSDLATLLGRPEGGPLPVRLATGRDGWALGLPALRPSPGLRLLLGVASGEPGPRRWRSPFGELWLREDAGVALASERALLALVAGPVAGDEGAVRGPEVAALAARLADALDRAPGTAEWVTSLRRGGEAMRPLATARWRITAAGGRVELGW